MLSPIFFYNLFINPSMRRNQTLDQEKNRTIQDCSQFQIDLESSSGHSHDNSDFVKQENKEKQKRRKKRIYSTKSKGNWDNDQDQRFLRFMIQNRQYIENRCLRRSNKIFKKMSKFVKTRSAEQCRSHHQKYEKKFENFDSIVNFIMKKTDNIESIIKIQQEYKDSAKKQPLEMNEEIIRQHGSQQKQMQNISQIKANKRQQKRKTKQPTDYTILTQNEGFELKILHTPSFQIHVTLGLEYIQNYDLGRLYQQVDR